MMELDEYIESHISPEPRHLADIYRHTHLCHVYPRMCMGHYEGRLLAMLTAMIRPKRILELGTFTGYSTLCLAEGMPPECRIDTVEINDEMKPELDETFAADPRGDDINLHIGDAMQVVPELKGPWDLVFIDANKRLYCDYLHLVLPRIPVGGWILADNTLWDGHILDADSCRDAQSRGIALFNDTVAADPRLEKVILPLRDGLTIIRKIAD